MIGVIDVDDTEEAGSLLLIIEGIVEMMTVLLVAYIGG